MTVRRAKDSQKAEHKLCPECNTSMVIVDQREENGALFTWYGCASGAGDHYAVVNLDFGG